MPKRCGESKVFGFVSKCSFACAALLLAIEIPLLAVGCLLSSSPPFYDSRYAEGGTDRKLTAALIYIFMDMKVHGILEPNRVVLFSSHHR